MTSKALRRHAIAPIAMAVYACVSLAFAELVARLAHEGARPMLPVILEDNGVARLPERWTGSVDYPGGERVEFVTGGCGERLRARGGDDGEGEVLLVIGDSQALGWGRHFDQTFGALIAAEAHGGPEHARLLAAPRMDPDRYAAVTRCYLASHPPPRRVLVALNLGNDLDELFLSRRIPASSHASGRLGRWLAVNSYAFLDLVILRRRLFADPIEDVAATNALCMLAPEEHELLARALVDSVLTLRGLFSEDVGFEVAVIPADYDVAGEEFEKYRSVYAAGAFRRWQIEAPTVSADMRRFRRRLGELFRERQVHVFDLGAEGDGPGFARLVFERTSHHLTEAGHVALARARGHVDD